MSNESLLVVSALVDITFIFIVARVQPHRLFGVIVINLILITIFGAKLITVFGFNTNAGNVFYACIFLATHFMLERQSKKEAYKIIGNSLLTLAFFMILLQLAVHFSSTDLTYSISESMRTVFALSLRIAGASASAYIFAQFVNIYVYDWIKNHTGGKFLWLQSNAANILAQLVDSCLFFTIAFIDVSGPILVQAILTGWIIKSAVVVLGTPFLYWDRYFLKKKS